MSNPGSQRYLWIPYGPLERDAFESCVAKQLVSALTLDNFVIMETLSLRMRSTVTEIIDFAPAESRYFPPLSLVDLR